MLSLPRILARCLALSLHAVTLFDSMLREAMRKMGKMKSRDEEDGEGVSGRLSEKSSDGDKDQAGMTIGCGRVSKRVAEGERGDEGTSVCHKAWQADATTETVHRRAHRQCKECAGVSCKECAAS